jgi:hypothetical protein
MIRVAPALLLSGIALVTGAGTASAQWGYGPRGFGGGALIPGNPLYPLTPYLYQPSFGIARNSVYGRVNVFVPNGLPNPLATASPFYTWYSNPRYRAGYGTMPWMGAAAGSSGYMSGGTRPNYALQYAQRAYDQSQHGGYGGNARDLIAGEWGYEKGAEPGAAARGGNPPPQDLLKAVGGVDEGALLSGESLNQILAAVIAAEAKGAKGPSGFLAPETLSAIRFAGPPAADALNLIRQAGKLPFPVAFDDPALATVREDLQRDFADATAPLREGKPADAARLAKFAFTLETAQQAAAPVLRNLPFDESSASRRFFHQLERTLAAMRAGNITALVNPAWASEGASVADLVKLMTKHKLQFGPAPAGGEEAYFTLHKELTTYYFVLTQPKK